MSQPAAADLRKAVKLFNRWQFQEAHDAFRHLADVGEGRERSFLEGLANLSAAFFRIWHKRGEANTMVTLLQKGIDQLRPFEKPTLGLEIAPILPALEECLNEAMRWRRGDSEIFNRDFIPRLDFVGGDDDEG
jgi:predicted metal-dependent hydrolase